MVGESLQDNMRFVSAQPDQRHFVWQTDVYLNNFISLGIPPQHCVALFGVDPGKEPSDDLRSLCQRYPTTDIQIYTDTRHPEGRGYAPSIQPHLICKMLEQYPDRAGPLTFYHDCDIAFRRLPDFDRMVAEYPDACLLSDTLSYIGYEYLHVHCEAIRAEQPQVPEDELIQLMCDVVGVDLELVRSNEACSGGAQYLLQDVGRTYWEKVYRDSIAIDQLFQKYFAGLKLSKEPKEYLQIWTAGMWAYLWNLWYFELETIVHSEMKFLFSGGAPEDPAPILHMAGLQEELKHNHFDKADWWQQSPVDLLPAQPYLFDHFPQNTVAREYANWIHQASGVKPNQLATLEPARYWRLLAWKTQHKSDIWDVEHIEFEFSGNARVVGYLESGNAGETYEVQRAFAPSPEIWGGRPVPPADCRAHFYLGVELDSASVPQRIELTQADSPHGTRCAILQFSHDAQQWTTAHVAEVDPRQIGQLVLYRSEQGLRSKGWRLIARTTSSGFAWDVHRVRFLLGEQEQSGKPCCSDYANAGSGREFAAAQAFQDGIGHWGGRPDARGHFILGVEATEPISVNRIVLHQGEEHWAESIEVQTLSEDGFWRPLRIAENLAAGLNDLVLFQEPESNGWIPPIAKRKSTLSNGAIEVENLSAKI